MPVLIAVLVISFVAGLLARPAVAYSVAGALAVFLNVAFIWAIADDKGDDPAWLLAFSIVGGLAALGATRVAIGLRGRSRPVAS